MAATDPLLLAAVNPTATLISWFRASGIIVSEFGDATHISGVNKGPYPQIRVSPSNGGSDRDMVWATEPEVLVEVYGDIDGTPGQAELRRLATLAFGVALQLADRDDYAPTDPVVNAVIPSSPTLFAADPATGQPRWYKTFRLAMHPPVSLTV